MPLSLIISLIAAVAGFAGSSTVVWLLSARVRTNQIALQQAQAQQAEADIALKRNESAIATLDIGERLEKYVEELHESQRKVRELTERQSQVDASFDVYRKKLADLGFELELTQNQRNQWQNRSIELEARLRTLEQENTELRAQIVELQTRLDAMLVRIGGTP